MSGEKPVMRTPVTDCAVSGADSRSRTDKLTISLNNTGLEYFILCIVFCQKCGVYGRGGHKCDKFQWGCWFGECRGLYVTGNWGIV